MRSLKQDKDTICACITAPGQSGIAVVRVSGENSDTIVRQLCSFLPASLESHRVYYGFLQNSASSEQIDEVLVTYFAVGRSFTGEATFEISSHGSQVIVSEILSLLVHGGARMAERGEFSYRAVMNGRLDLVQAEGILELIRSRSKRAAQMALKQLQGGFSQSLKEIKSDLTWVLANLEANIDFAAEDIVIADSKALKGRLDVVIGKVESLLDNQRRGRILQSGYHVVLAGRPNAGKSSLLNTLLNEERAIVTATAGTTRDLIDAQISINGFSVTITDSAGLRQTEDEVEKIGVARTMARTQEVDRVFYLVDGEVGWTKDDAENWERLPRARTTLVWNKSDLSGLKSNWIDQEVIEVSARTGEGVEDLMSHLGELIGQEFLEDSPAILNARHFEGLRRIEKSLALSTALILQEESPDLIALELQVGLQSVHELLGLDFDDQVMDRVFQEFCIGK